MTFSCLLGTASGASLLPPLSVAFHYIGNQRFRVLVKVVLATYFCVATDAPRSLLRSTVDEAAAAAASSKQCLASGGLPGHYFGAATDAARLWLQSTAEDVVATASGKQRLEVRAVIVCVEGNVPRGQFQVTSPADKYADPSWLKDVVAGACHALCTARRGRGMLHR